MRRTNTFNDVATTGRVQVDAGDGITMDLPVTAASTTDVSGLAARLAALEYDTGWRDVSADLRNSAQGILHIRRVGMRVRWRVKNFLSGTSHDFYIPPAGFIAPADANVYSATLGSTVGSFYRHQNGRLCRSIYDEPVFQGVWWEGSYTLPPGTPPVTTPPGKNT